MYICTFFFFFFSFNAPFGSDRHAWTNMVQSLFFFPFFRSELKGLISVFLVSYLTITLTKVLIVHQKTQNVPKEREIKRILLRPLQRLISGKFAPSLAFNFQQSLVVRWSDCFKISVLYMSNA